MAEFMPYTKLIEAYMSEWSTNNEPEPPEPRRFLTVTKDDDGDRWLSTYDTLEEALAGFEDEILGERAWWPHALFDLEERKSLPLAVSVKVTQSEDPGALVEDWDEAFG
ncbi:MAG TPA: hypothetical protein VF147_03035 [Vicinamibacterales bacterium]